MKLQSATLLEQIKEFYGKYEKGKKKKKLKEVMDPFEEEEEKGLTELELEDKEKREEEKEKKADRDKMFDILCGKKDITRETFVSLLIFFQSNQPEKLTGHMVNDILARCGFNGLDPYNPQDRLHMYLMELHTKRKVEKFMKDFYYDAMCEEATLPWIEHTNNTACRKYISCFAACSF